MRESGYFDSGMRGIMKSTGGWFKKVSRITGQFFLWMSVTLLLLLAGFWMMLYLIARGPSVQIRNVFVTSVKETSAAGFLADIFLSRQEILAITAQTTDGAQGENTDAALLSFVEEGGEDDEGEDIEIVDIHGALYRGKLMIVKDPSRVKVGVCDDIGKTTKGMSLLEIVTKYDAVGGINGGRYNDEYGFGRGGEPLGIVFSEGKLLSGALDQSYDLYGFDKNHVFRCGTMTGQQALDMGIRDAVTFGPALVVNGKVNPAHFASLNPRTAIGQREDGAVLLLVIEGRQSSSIGASLQDLSEIMLEYGAINAANLDGGMSSSMIYEGEEIAKNCSIKAARDMPTAFVVQ